MENHEKLSGNSTEIPRKIYGHSEEIPGTQYSTVQEKELSPDGDSKKDTAVAAVMSAYMDRINPSVSEQLVAEMLGFIQVMGQECCLRAIRIAQDERKTQWSYVRGILRSKQAQGVRCLADWDAIEAQREKKKQGESDGYEYL